MAQTPEVSAANQATTQRTASSLSLSVVNRNGLIDISADIEDARIVDVAAQLSQRLRIPVVVGPAVEQETVRTHFADTPFETALLSFAPRVYVEYELRRGAQPLPQRIYLLGLADPPMVASVASDANAHGVLIQGNTEETPSKSGRDPLTVAVDRDRLTLTSDDQLLTVVMMAISEALHVPLDLTYDNTERVSAELRDAVVEDAILRLSSNVRLQVRADLTRLTRTVLRIVVTPATP